MLSDALHNLCRFTAPVGSRVTCSPAPEDTDEDWLCLALDLTSFVEAAKLEGYSFGGSGHSEEPMSFVSLKREADRMNLIATACPTFCDAFVLATGLSKRFNLVNKADRIALFQAVLYGNAVGD